MDMRQANGFAPDLPLLDLDAFDLAAIPSHLVDEQIVRRHTALPLVKRGERLFVAVSDPGNVAATEEIAKLTGLDVEPVRVDREKLLAAIEDYRSVGHDTLLGELDEQSDIDIGIAEEPADDAPDAVDEAPVVKYIHRALLHAIDAGASDIHFEPYAGCYRVRMRVDGILREALRPPANFGRRFAARLKVMARMDVTERRIPQDGRIGIASGRRAVDFRVSTLPTMHGEKVALRVLDPASAQLQIEDLGFEDVQRERYLAALGRPQGMVLVTGPTGSGKTVSVYAGLNLLNGEHRNVATVEDPVEIDVEGINQVQVNAKVGLDFATALRAFLRQDPDVVMVGEVRDRETAETAVKAAQTGHLVLSTLHTNSAAETLTRLLNMGVPAYNLATSVTLIVAQRLVRRLCPSCRWQHELPRETLLAEGFDAAEVDAGIALFEASETGCEACDHGFSGRTGIYEVVELSPPLQRMILAGGDSLALAEKARELGYDDLRRSGLRKAMRGVTSLREVNRVATAA